GGEMEGVGLGGRGGGIDADGRRDGPFGAYGETGVNVSVYGAGDVWARTMVRLDEAREAARLIREAARLDAPGAARVEIPPLTAGAHAFGLVEAWRGPVWHWVVAGGPSALGRVKGGDPS